MVLQVHLSSLDLNEAPSSRMGVDLILPPCPTSSPEVKSGVDDRIFGDVGSQDVFWSFRCHFPACPTRESRLTVVSVKARV